MQGRFFRTGLGELPGTALSEGGALSVAPPINRPPLGTESAPLSSGGMRQLAENQSSWQAVTFTATAEPLKIQDFLYRKFLLVQNKSSTGALYVGFGYIPTLGNGLVLAPGVGYEPYSYPINEIYVVSDGASIDGVLIYGV